jgi:MFS family permease
VSVRSVTAPSFFRDKFGGLHHSFWVLWGGTLVNRLGTMVQPFFAFFLTGARGLSLAAAGVVLTVYGAGALFSQLLAGWLADRFGRRVTLTAGMLATALVMVVLGYSQSLVAIAASMFLLGLSMEIYRPASNALVADVTPPVDRPRAFALLFWAVNIGFIGGVLSGGWLAQTSILALFWVNAAACTTFGLMVWFLVGEPDRGVRGAGETGRFLDVLGDRVMLGYVLITTTYGFVYLQSLLTLPLAMKGEGLPPSAYGLAMATNGLIIVALQPLLVTWLGRHDHSRVVAVGMVIVGAGFGLTMFASSTLGYMATVMVWSFGEIVFTGVSAAIAVDLAPAHLRGRYSGLYGFAWSLANLLAPAAGTRLLGVGPATLWTTCAAVCLVAAAGQVLLAPAIRRRTALLSRPVAPAPEDIPT